MTKLESPAHLIRADRFHFVQTDDGSPSVQFKLPDEALSETMHNLRGAYSETVYIYGEALGRMLELGLPAEILSMGLGLGYNEILSAAYLVNSSQADSARLESFEIDTELRTLFAAWVRDEQIPNEFQATYDDVLKRASQTRAVSTVEIKALLNSWLTNRQLVLREALTADTKFDGTFTCYLFDAFSSKTSPDLWDETFLTKFFSTTSSERAVFSTYACTGSLKRSLRASGFTLMIREGFSSKRDCTFAFK